MISAESDKSRIPGIFASLRAQGRTALMPFLTAGFPDLDTSLALLSRFEKAGASICEIGIPYSDPIADGPVIASSMHDALQADFKLEAMLARIAEIRSALGIGLVAMVSYSIAHRVGIEQFVSLCAQAGFDGFIFPDLPVEESPEALSAAAEAGLTCSLLIAPNTPDRRVAKIASACTGFVYLLARTGITGEHEGPPDIEARVRLVRSACDTPIACGFGISSPATVREVTRHADAAIVGSAIVRRIGESAHLPGDEVIERAGGFVAELCTGLAPRPLPLPGEHPTGDRGAEEAGGQTEPDCS